MIEEENQCQRYRFSSIEKWYRHNIVVQLKLFTISDVTHIERKRAILENAPDSIDLKSAKSISILKSFIIRFTNVNFVMLGIRLDFMVMLSMFMEVHYTHMSCNDDAYSFNPVYRSNFKPAFDIVNLCIPIWSLCGIRTRSGPLQRHSNSTLIKIKLYMKWIMHILNYVAE